VNAGAVTAIPRCAAPSLVQRAFEAAVERKSLLPVEVVRAITGKVPNAEVHCTGPSEEEIDWLRQLARGSTVADLAEHTGYSFALFIREAESAESN
jgi:hypothetical protein